MDKLLIIVIALTVWLPWTGEAKEMLTHAKVILDEVVDCPNWRGLYDHGKRTVHICKKTTRKATPMVLLHESQHYLILEYELYEEIDWTKFERLALACAKHHSRKAWILANKFALLNPMELHAQLPWLVHGNLCPKLQSYYPWFDLRDYELEIENIYPRRQRRTLGRHH